jgi:hypothetical protein
MMKSERPILPVIFLHEHRHSDAQLAISTMNAVNAVNPNMMAIAFQQIDKMHMFLLFLMY